MSAVARMIEVAQKERRYNGEHDEVLVVLDGQVRCLVAFDDDHFVANTYDHSGRGFLATSTQRVEAVQRSLDGYLDIVNNPS